MVSASELFVELSNCFFERERAAWRFSREVKENHIKNWNCLLCDRVVTWNERNIADCSKQKSFVIKNKHEKKLLKSKLDESTTLSKHCCVERVLSISQIQLPQQYIVMIKVLKIYCVDTCYHRHTMNSLSPLPPLFSISFVMNCEWFSES